MKFKWQQAPIYTAWGDDMVVTSVAIDKDHTVDLYCEHTQTDKVESMFTDPSAQPQQEPVAHCRVRPLQGGQSFPTVEVDWASRPIPGPLYTSPPAQRKPLTDEEIEQCMKQAYSTAQGRLLERAFVRAIEAAHGIKENT